MKPVNIKGTRRQTEKRTKRVNTSVSHNRSGSAWEPGDTPREKRIGAL